MSHLDGKHQQTVVYYATFLVQQYKIQTPLEAGLKPKAIARPEQESVIGAIIKIEKNLLHDRFRYPARWNLVADGATHFAWAGGFGSD